MTHFLGVRQWWHCLRHPGHRPLKIGNGWVIRLCMDCEWRAAETTELLDRFNALPPVPVIRADGSES